jgi:outer membrane protein assembly factor BamB
MRPARISRGTARRLLAVSAALGLALAGKVGGQEWLRFRGPNGSGVSPATTIPIRWTEKDPNWKVKLPGVGHSSPVLWGERIFVTGGEEGTGKRFLVCLKTSDGSRLWTRDFAGERHGKHADNSFASATPVLDEKHVYVSWAGPKEYLVAAVDHDGKEIWRTDLGPYRSGHGFGTSPIVHGDLLIVPSDQDGPSTLFALECGTGKVRWKVPRKSKASYATPCVFQPDGRPAELIFTSYEHGVTGIDPQTGRTNWELDVFFKGHVETPIGSPIVAGDLVLAPCGWLGVKKEVVALRSPARGKEAKDVVAFRLDRSAPLCTTPLIKDDLLFLWSDEGLVSCADARTGKVHWRERVPGSYYSSPIWIAGHLYNVSREGDVLVLAAGKEFKQVARNPLGEGSHSTPAVAGGRLYVRTFSHLISIGGKAAKEGAR